MNRVVKSAVVVMVLINLVILLLTVQARVTGSGSRFKKLRDNQELVLLYEENGRVRRESLVNSETAAIVYYYRVTDEFIEIETIRGGVRVGEIKAYKGSIVVNKK